MNNFAAMFARRSLRLIMTSLGRLVSALLLCASLPLSSASAETITVISDDNYPPYLFKDANGNTVGIVADFWKLWEQKTGVKVTLVSTAWEQAQQQLLSGHADVIEMIFKDAEREQKYDFSASYASLPVGIYAHESISGLAAPAALSGFTVGVQKGDGCIFKLKEAGVKSFRLYNNYEEIIQATLNGQVKIVCMDDYPAHYYLYRLNADSQILRAFTLYQGQFHRAVKKGNGRMLTLVEQGAAAISPAELTALESKWKGSSLQRNEYSKQVMLTLALLLVVGLTLLLLIFMLRVAVKRKTAEIQSKRAELELERLRLTDIIDATRAGTWEWDVQTGLCQFNQRWAEILGYTLDELVPHNVETAKRLTHPDDWHSSMTLVSRHLTGEIAFYECDIRMRHKAGHWVWIADRGRLISRTDAGEPAMMRGTHIDITDKKQADAAIWRQANYDSLTQLPNRHYFNHQLKEAITAAATTQQHLTLLLLDLDRFKEVNDSLGHRHGDELLIEVGRRILKVLSAAATVARLGGDEFAIILPAGLHADLQGLCHQLMQEISKAYILGGERVFVTVSIGISQYPEDALHAEEMTQHADLAMYEAKSRGRNSARFFSLAIRDALSQRLNLARDLRVALENSELRVYYQPIVSLANGKIIKAEALMRWQHPERGLISPALFIPVAEETGDIIAMGDWIFLQAAQHAMQWQTLMGDDFAISVNKSPVQFVEQLSANSDWVNALHKMGLEGKRIVVEITEGLLLNPDPVVEQRLMQLKDMGIQVAIDDFGTGYSSLSYLSKFDIDYLKIDQSFTRHLNVGNESYVLCEAIIVMAHKLGLKVIAEGVETALQRDLLIDIHCDYAQGFFYSPPVPAEAFEQMLIQQSREAAATTR
ncbi:EAL domain-containing protein [Methylophilus sp.]|jgi:diguanylate cyclase (GGDEF)-like protein/PAS domain S-box-containing protein|uniref:EAL domain-containing protein n=1 Tax=Methylophilus sp. TaxID=29541 RepID=UPI0025FFFCF3|nr:EAL domain-containing protein [Methylophilus sp.]